MGKVVSALANRNETHGKEETNMQNNFPWFGKGNMENEKPQSTGCGFWEKECEQSLSHPVPVIPRLV